MNDFHTHTPASVDFSDRELTPEDWLKAFMEKEIDCVAITDHNSGEWIDRLKHTLKELQENKPHWKNHIYYRLNWSPTADNPSLEQKKNDGIWEPFQGEIKPLFPAYIYS